MFQSATIKLTAWYLAIVMTISLIFSVVLYHLATIELANGIRRESARIYSQYPVFQGDPTLRSTTDYSRSARHILAELIIFNLAVLVLAGLASYFLARRTLAPIEEAHAQQTRFTADVSHELRTPLTALKMESEVALMDSTSSAKQLRGTLKSNLEEVAKMEALINNLLRLTKLDAGQLAHDFNTVNARTLSQAALDQVAQAAESHDIRFINSVKDDNLFGDPASLTQALVILLDNAIKYSPPGKTVELSSGSDTDSVWIRVTDHGHGIAKDALEHIFDRFYRAETSRTKTTAEGYGLGLSIAQMIADVHNGHIAIASRLGHGTTATLRLPKSNS